MACNLFSDPLCSQALANDFTPLTPSNLTELQGVFTQAGMAGNFNDICNNIQSYGTPCNNNPPISDVSNQSQVSFNLAIYLGALAKAVKFDSSMATELENRIDEVWAINDRALVAAGFTMPDNTGTVGSIVPYNPFYVPTSYDVNVAHCGWSRYFQFADAATNPDYATARSRIEVLTDSVIISNMLEAIQCLKECGSTDQTKITQWLADIKCIIDVYIPSCVIDGPLNGVDPDGSGVSVTITGTGIVDNFGNIIPLNQQAIFLDALLRYEECTGDTSYNAREKAAKFNITVDQNQFYQVNGQDIGWYYSLKSNLVEPPEDFGHTAITFRYLKYAAQEGIFGARTLLNRMVDSLMANSYQGNGYFAWYNDGNTGHGSTDNVSGGTINWGPLFSNASFTGGAGANGDASYYHAWVLSELPPEANAAYNAQIGAALNRFISSANSTASQNNALARMCLALDVCSSVHTVYAAFTDPNPYGNVICADCNTVSVTGVQDSYRAGSTLEFSVNNYNGLVTVKTEGAAVATLTQNTNGTYLFQLPIGCSTNARYDFCIQDQGCPRCDLFSTICTGGTGFGTDPECFGDFSCNLYVERRGKDEHTEIDFGYEEVCIDFGKASTTPLLPETLSNAKGLKCGVQSKTCISPHETCFIWCNLCLDSSANAFVTGTIGGDAGNLCECEDGLFWRFASRYNVQTSVLSPASYNLSVPGEDGKGKYADTIIIWDHNFCNDYTNVIELFVDGVKIKDFIVDPKCKHCCGNDGGCSPVYMYLDKGIVGTDWQLKFFTKPGYIHCIGTISMGISFPIDLFAGFQNIFNASKYTRSSAGTECGWAPSTLVEKVHDLTIELVDLEESWFVDYWDDFIWYADRYPFYFVFSKNNRPELISRVRLKEAGVDSSEYTDEICQSLTLNLEARRHPDIKNKSEDSFSCPVADNGLMEIDVKKDVATVLTFTDITGVDQNENCQISSVQFATNNSLNTVNAVSGQIVVQLGTGEGVSSKLDYTIKCGNFEYDCQISLRSV